MKKVQIGEIFSDRGFKLITEKIYNTINVNVVIGYSIPIAMDPKFDGVGHMVEHLLFRDLKNGMTSSEAMAYFSKLGIEINAVTTDYNILFYASMSSFQTPLAVCTTNAYSRFDNPQEKITALIEFINCVVKKHHIEEDWLSEEKDIVISELEESLSDRQSEVHNLISNAYYRKSILGNDKETVSRMSIKLIEDFLGSLPSPVISLQYNPEIDAFRSLDRQVYESVKNVNFNKGKSFKEFEYHMGDNFVPIKSLNETLMLPFYKRSDNGNCLNSVIFEIPVSLGTDKYSLESNLMTQLAMESLFSMNVKDSFNSLLRDSLGLTYGVNITRLYKIKGDMFNAIAVGVINSDCCLTDLRYLANNISKFYSTMNEPSREEFRCLIIERAKACLNTAINGHGHMFIYNDLSNFEIDYQINELEFDSDFNYDTFIATYRAILGGIRVVLV